MLTRRTLLQLAVFAVSSISLPAFAAEGFELEPGLRLLAPITVDQLSVFPVVKVKAERPLGEYLTLAEGLKSKQVSVSELENGGSVNQVRVKNSSDKALLLLGGEIILGGQQDRVISADTLVEPRRGAVVQVFCVEHGRWAGSSAFSRTGGFAENKLRRLAKFDKGQGGVWDQVAKKTGALEAGSGTGTYRTLAEGAQGKASVARFAAVKARLKALPEAAEIVGVVAAVNGVVRSVEIFAAPALFASYREGLLDSMFIDAADSTVDAAAAPPKPQEVKDFIHRAEAAPAEDAELRANGKTVHKNAKGVSGATLETSDQKPVYRSYSNTGY